MSLTPVQTANGSTTIGTTLGVIFGSSVTAGNSIIAVASSKVQPITNVTDSQSNTYVEDVSEVNGVDCVSIWRCSNVVGGSVTVTFHVGSTAIIDAGVLEVPGSISLDQTNVSTVGGKDPVTGAITSTVANELFVMALQSTSVSGPSTFPSGTTNLYTQSTSGAVTSGDYIVVTSIQSSVVYQWVVSTGASTNATVIATYFASAAPVHEYPQQSQRFDSLPDLYFQYWEQPRLLPSQTPVFPGTSQRLDQLVDQTYSWYEQVRQQPVPNTFLLLPPALRNPYWHQRIDPLYDYAYEWREQYRIQPVPGTFLPTPIPPQRSQRFDPLPDFSQYYEQFTRQPIPTTFLPTPFPPQASQRIEPLPDYNWKWWEEFRPQPQPVTFLINPFPPQASQRIDQLPDFFQSWEQWRQQPIPLTYLPLPPALRNPHWHQRVDSLPDLSQYYEQFRIQPQPVTFLPSPPLINPQKSQRFDPLPDYTYQWWEQWKKWPIPVEFKVDNPPVKQLDQSLYSLPEFTHSWWQQYRFQPIPVSYIPSFPPTRQPDQTIINLPNLWQEYQAYTQQPLSQWYIPPRPPGYQSSQRLYSVPDFTYQWWEQFRLQPFPTAPPVPTAPPGKQQDQFLYSLPVHGYQWWEPQSNSGLLLPQPLPSGIVSSQVGTYGVYVLISGCGQTGGFRVANNIQGYNVWVGTNGLPDLTQPPTQFSLTLPIAIPVTPPVTGTKTFYVLVRAQDVYGLNSQNSYYTTVTVNSSSVIVLSALAPPQSLTLFQLVDQGIRVLAQYPGFSSDEDPATMWYIWSSQVMPNPMNPPTLTIPASKILATSLGPDLAPGLWYVSVALFRQIDSTLSPVITGTVTINSTPPEVTPVLSGYQGN